MWGLEEWIRMPWSPGTYPAQFARDLSPNLPKKDAREAEEDLDPMEAWRRRKAEEEAKARE
eukprot:CAMPEP_0172597300 /NCGR_PEP_ID=MMETSP1068-20121228/17282_1 /TAXON_ID=35684 /ORGANISM="Pseudopedinella elastica, Strain CCMP716" /LENGTH=60 /DNA_ID=CAMNT_0013396763 /DNA_START=15 /DNA_END=194 /DNA_ORIENTATION=-